MKHQYKTWVIDELTSWSETFNNNYPDHLEEVIQEEQKSFETIHSLINKLSLELPYVRLSWKIDLPPILLRFS